MKKKLAQSVSVQMASTCWRHPWTERQNYGHWRMAAVYRHWIVTQTTSLVARSRTTATLSSQRAKIILARSGGDSIGFRCVLSFCLLSCSLLTLYTSMQFKRSYFEYFSRFYLFFVKHFWPRWLYFRCHQMARLLKLLKSRKLVIKVIKMFKELKVLWNKL